LIRPLQERPRDRQPERLRGPEVDDEVEACRLLDGEIGGSRCFTAKSAISLAMELMSKSGDDN